MNSRRLFASFHALEKRKIERERDREREIGEIFRAL
jgi:hypothetical protein